MRQKWMKQSVSPLNFKAEKRRLNAINLESDASSCRSETTRSSALSLEKPEAASYSPKHSSPNALLHGASRCLESLRSLMREWRRTRRHPFQATSRVNAQRREINACLSASTRAMQDEPTVLVLGNCESTHEFVTWLQRSMHCDSPKLALECAPYGENWPRRPEWVHLMDRSNCNINEQIEKFHLHIYRPHGGEQERKLSRLGRLAEMTAVLFVANISLYNGTSGFDEGFNRIMPLIIWWDSLVNTRCLDLETTMPFILCLLGVEDFRRKLEGHPLSDDFHDYRGKDEQEALDYVLARFREMERVPRRVYPLMIENWDESDVVAEQLISVMKTIVAEKHGVAEKNLQHLDQQ